MSAKANFGYDTIGFGNYKNKQNNINQNRVQAGNHKII